MYDMFVTPLHSCSDSSTVTATPPSSTVSTMPSSPDVTTQDDDEGHNNNSTIVVLDSINDDTGANITTTSGIPCSGLHVLLQAATTHLGYLAEVASSQYIQDEEDERHHNDDPIKQQRPVNATSNSRRKNNQLGEPHTTPPMVAEVDQSPIDDASKLLLSTPSTSLLLLASSKQEQNNIRLQQGQDHTTFIEQLMFICCYPKYQNMISFLPNGQFIVIRQSLFSQYFLQSVSASTTMTPTTTTTTMTSSTSNLIVPNRLIRKKCDNDSSTVTDNPKPQMINENTENIESKINQDIADVNDSAATESKMEERQIDQSIIFIVDEFPDPRNITRSEPINPTVSTTSSIDNDPTLYEYPIQTFHDFVYLLIQWGFRRINYPILPMKDTSIKNRSHFRRCSTGSTLILQNDHHRSMSSSKKMYEYDIAVNEILPEIMIFRHPKFNEGDYTLCQVIRYGVPCEYDNDHHLYQFSTSIRMSHNNASHEHHHETQSIRSTNNNEEKLSQNTAQYHPPRKGNIKLSSKDYHQTLISNHQSLNPPSSNGHPAIDSNKNNKDNHQHQNGMNTVTVSSSDEMIIGEDHQHQQQPKRRLSPGFLQQQEEQTNSTYQKVKVISAESNNSTDANDKSIHDMDSEPEQLPSMSNKLSERKVSSGCESEYTTITTTTSSTVLTSTSVSDTVTDMVVSPSLSPTNCILHGEPKTTSITESIISDSTNGSDSENRNLTSNKMMQVIPTHEQSLVCHNESASSIPTSCIHSLRDMAVSIASEKLQISLPNVEPIVLNSSHIHADNEKNIEDQTTSSQELLNDKEQQQSQPISTPSLIDIGISTCTYEVVTSAIECILYDQQHTEKVYHKNEKELSRSSLPGIIPICKHIFDDVVPNESSSSSTSTPTNSNTKHTVISTSPIYTNSSNEVAPPTLASITSSPITETMTTSIVRVVTTSSTEQAK